MRVNSFADKRIAVSINALQDGKTKLVIIYPREASYRDHIMGALSEVLRREDEPSNVASSEDTNLQEARG